jgi:hypothetical protein
MSKNPFDPVPAPGEYHVDPSTRFSTVKRRQSRGSIWVTGREAPQEGVGPFNRVPDGWRPRARRSRWVMVE